MIHRIGEGQGYFSGINICHRNDKEKTFRGVMVAIGKRAFGFLNLGKLSQHKLTWVYLCRWSGLPMSIVKEKRMECK